MLVLSRREDESVVIDDQITVYVVEIHHDRVRLGFTAPPHVKIHRQEVMERIERKKIAEASDEPAE